MINPYSYDEYIINEGKLMLTRKQYELLIFIHNKLQDTGVSPSIHVYL